MREGLKDRNRLNTVGGSASY